MTKIDCFGVVVGGNVVLDGGVLCLPGVGGNVVEILTEKSRSKQLISAKEKYEIRMKRITNK